MTNRLLKCAVVAVGLVLGACSGGAPRPDAGPGPDPDAGSAHQDAGSANQLSGAGAFTVVSAGEATLANPDGGALGWNYVELDFGAVDLSATCTLHRDGGAIPSVTGLVLRLDVSRPPLLETTPGTYPVGSNYPAPASNAEAALVNLVNDQVVSVVAEASSGSLTFTTVGPGGATGTFDLTMTFSDGGTGALAGTFEAPFCWVQ